MILSFECLIVVVGRELELSFEGRCEKKPDILRSSGKREGGKERGRAGKVDRKQVSNENRNGAC